MEEVKELVSKEENKHFRSMLEYDFGMANLPDFEPYRVSREPHIDVPPVRLPVDNQGRRKSTDNGDMNVWIINRVRKVEVLLDNMMNERFGQPYPRCQKTPRNLQTWLNEMKSAVKGLGTALRKEYP